MEYTGDQAQIALVAAGERGAIHPGGLNVFVFWDRQEEEATCLNGIDCLGGFGAVMMESRKRTR